MVSMEQAAIAPRKALSRRLRFEILRRDNNTCRYCHATDTPLTIDHVVPVALGGTDDPSNLVAACRDCNAGKTSSAPDAALVEQASADALRWSAAMQVAAGKMRDDFQAEWDYAEALDAEWSNWSYGYSNHPIPRPSDWRNSANAWRVAGLPVDLMVDAARRALSSKKVDPSSTWKYFCGIAWKRITEIQEAAKASLAQTATQSEDRDPYDAGFDDGCDTTMRVPSVNYGNLMFRALSRVVDGYGRWNHRNIVDGELV